MDVHFRQLWQQNKTVSTFDQFKNWADSDNGRNLQPKTKA